ncbi:hypothetical protein ABPG75_011070 [Micractinium tetrahymenae]
MTVMPRWHHRPCDSSVSRVPPALLPSVATLTMPPRTRRGAQAQVKAADLPDDCLESILASVPSKERLRSCCLVSRSWHRASHAARLLLPLSAALGAAPAAALLGTQPGQEDTRRNPSLSSTTLPLQGQVSVSASKALAAEALAERYQHIRALVKLLTKLTQGDWQHQQQQQQGWQGPNGSAAAGGGADGQAGGEGVDVAQVSQGRIMGIMVLQQQRPDVQVVAIHS